MRASRIIQEYIRADKALELADTEFQAARAALTEALSVYGPLRENEEIYALENHNYGASVIVVSAAPKEAWSVEIPEPIKNEVQSKPEIEQARRQVGQPAPCGGVIGSEVPDHPF